MATTASCHQGVARFWKLLPNFRLKLSMYVTFLKLSMYGAKENDVRVKFVIKNNTLIKFYSALFLQLKD